MQSKTPAGVKFQQSMLSIDDEDFKDNLYQTYEEVAKSMINTHFANMQGNDLVKLSDAERDLLMQSGLDFPLDEEGNPTNQLDIIWDNSRATFDFEMDAEEDKTADDEKKLEALLKIVELRATDPTIEQSLMMSGKQLNLGELFSTIIKLTTDNDKILEEVSPEEMEMQQGMQAQGMQDPMQDPGVQQEQQIDPAMEEDLVNLQAIMQEHGVSEEEAMAMLEAEKQGFEPDEILSVLEERRANVQGWFITILRSDLTIS